MIFRNIRNEKEFVLVTDGQKLFRLHPKFKMPKGLRKVHLYFDKNVYNRQGWLYPEFCNTQKIQPRNNMTYLIRSIKAALASWQLKAL